jgi:hypothetical protein
MFSTWLVSTTESLPYCRVHQRAWVEPLSQWVAFPAPTVYGSPVTEAVCDTCTACVRRTAEALWPARASSGAASGSPLE